MPIMDGIEATKEIRKLEEQCKVNVRSRIVALSAYTSEMFSEKFAEAGMDNFITKPVNSEHIRRIIRELF